MKKEKSNDEKKGFGFWEQKAKQSFARILYLQYVDC